MSVKASSWVWEESQARGAAFLVLLALADHAGLDGGDCWPSVGRLARRCRVDERTVQRSVDILQGLGELVVEDQAGPKGTHRYRLTFATTPSLDLTGPTTPPPVDKPGDNPPDEAVDPRHHATPGTTPPPASCRQTPGTTPPESRENREKTPLPPASGGTGSLGVGDEHDGRHPNCRSCGTNRRGPKPPDPEQEAAIRRRAALAERTAEHAARAAEARAGAVPPPPGIRDRLRGEVKA